jgi:hypothetical protein
VRALWAIPAIVGSVMIVLISAFYIGSAVDPFAHLLGPPGPATPSGVAIQAPRLNGDA